MFVITSYIPTSILNLKKYLKKHYKYSKKTIYKTNF